MEKIIFYTNGCSHTAMSDTEYNTSYSEIVFKELYGEEYYMKFKLSNGISTKLLKHYIENTNENVIYQQAKHGKSNDLIFFETINFIHSCISTNKKIDLILLQWSGVNRRFHTNFEGDILNVNVHDNKGYGIKFEPVATSQTLQYMKLFEDICKFYNIKYICIPYMEVDESVFNQSIYKNQIDFTKYTTSLTEGHRNYFRKDGYSIDFHGHPNAQGVYHLSELILKLLGKNKISPIEHYFTEYDLKKQATDKEQSLMKKLYNKLGDGIFKKEWIDNFI